MALESTSLQSALPSNKNADEGEDEPPEGACQVDAGSHTNLSLCHIETCKLGLGFHWGRKVASSEAVLLRNKGGDEREKKEEDSSDHFLHPS